MTENRQRQELVQSLIRSGIKNQRVLAAIAATPREAFIPAALHERAYEDTALPIGEGQTISQPYIVALMTSALELTGEETVLEIGTGSGYQAAILSQLCRKVVTVERIAELSRSAQIVLEDLGCDNLIFHVGDGSLGYPAGAPYEGIVVTATAPHLPPDLCNQLAPGGRMAIPLGEGDVQKLQRITRRDDGLHAEKLCDVRFVPLIGEQGWRDGGG